MPRSSGFGKLGGDGKGLAQSSASAATARGRKRDRFFQFLNPHSRNPSPNPPISVVQQSPSPSSSVLQPAPSPNRSSSALHQTLAPTPSGSVLQQSGSPNTSNLVLQPAPWANLPSSAPQQTPSSNPASSTIQQATIPNSSSSVLQHAAAHIPSGCNDLWTKVYNNLPDEIKQQLGLNKLGPADQLQTLQHVLQTAVQAKEANIAKRLKFKCGDKEVDVQETADRLVGWITKFKEVGDIAVQYDPVHAALPWAGVRYILLVRNTLQSRENHYNDHC